MNKNELITCGLMLLAICFAAGAYKALDMKQQRQEAKEHADYCAKPGHYETMCPERFATVRMQ